MVAEGVLTPKAALTQIAGIDLGSSVRTRFAPPVPPTLAIAGGEHWGRERRDRAGHRGGRPPGGRRDADNHCAPGHGDLGHRGHGAGRRNPDGVGGRTSHAAVVARQLGKVCLVACPRLEIDLERSQRRIGDTVLDEGDMLALDGNTGAVHAGKLAVVQERPDAALATVAGWRSAAA